MSGAAEEKPSFERYFAPHSNRSRAERIAAINTIEHILTPKNDIRLRSSQWNVGDTNLCIDPVGRDTRVIRWTRGNEALALVDVVSHHRN
jgi:hypothetical protein